MFADQIMVGTLILLGCVNFVEGLTCDSSSRTIFSFLFISFNIFIMIIDVTLIEKLLIAVPIFAIVIGILLIVILLILPSGADRDRSIADEKWEKSKVITKEQQRERQDAYERLIRLLTEGEEE